MEARHHFPADVPRQQQKVVGGYRKIRDLGVGSFGKAIMVENAETKERCVMKAVDIARLGPQQRTQSLNEAKLLGSIKHPFIIGYRESFISAGFLCIITDFADGGDLHALIRNMREQKKRFSERQILRWFAQAVLALKHLHDKHILHRDVKSQNIFICTTGRIRLGDFGIAKSLNSTRELANTMIGTPYYLSPEICNNKPYSWASDVWALGCVLFEMAALRVPFEGKNMKFLGRQIILGKTPPFPTEYSPALRSICAKMLRKEPQARPSAAEILQERIIQRELEAMLREEDARKNYQSNNKKATIGPTSLDITVSNNHHLDKQIIGIRGAEEKGDLLSLNSGSSQKEAMNSDRIVKRKIAIARCNGERVPPTLENSFASPSGKKLNAQRKHEHPVSQAVNIISPQTRSTTAGTPQSLKEGRIRWGTPIASEAPISGSFVAGNVSGTWTRMIQKCRKLLPSRESSASSKNSTLKDMISKSWYRIKTGP